MEFLYIETKILDFFLGEFFIFLLHFTIDFVQIVVEVFEYHVELLSN